MTEQITDRPARWRCRSCDSALDLTTALTWPDGVASVICYTCATVALIELDPAAPDH